LRQDLLNRGAAPDDVAEFFPNFILENLVFPFETFLPLETTEG
jgi:hypothetical protein